MWTKEPGLHLSRNFFLFPSSTLVATVWRVSASWTRRGYELGIAGQNEFESRIIEGDRQHTRNYQRSHAFAMKKWTTEDMPDQTGKLAIVTGATGCLGFEAARALAVAGAQLILAVRDFKKGNEAEKRIREAAPKAIIMVEYLDLASLESVADFADRMIDCYSAIDLLINNAAESPTVDARHDPRWV